MRGTETNSLKCLIDKGGEITEEPDQTMEEVEYFYMNLYRSEGIERSCKETCDTYSIDE